MLKQQTRKRLQSLVQHPDFIGSVNIRDSKRQFDNKIYNSVDVDIFGDGYNLFKLLAAEFPDMKLASVVPYETDHGDCIAFGSYGNGVIEQAEVRAWATYGQKEKLSTGMESNEEITHIHLNTNESIAEMVEREA